MTCTKKTLQSHYQRRLFVMIPVHSSLLLLLIFFFCPSISPTFTQMANVLTGQFVGFQPAFGVESADHKIICEPAGTGAEAGGHFETGPVVPLSLKQGAY